MSIDRVVGASVRRRGRRVPRLAFLGRSLCLGSPLFPKSRKRLLRRFLQGELGLCAQLFSSSRAPAPISSGPGQSLTHIMLEERTLPEKVKEQVARRQRHQSLQPLPCGPSGDAWQYGH